LEIKFRGNVGDLSIPKQRPNSALLLYILALCQYLFLTGTPPLTKEEKMIAPFHEQDHL
jgi:hypothetical protein